MEKVSSGNESWKVLKILLQISTFLAVMSEVLLRMVPKWASTICSQKILKYGLIMFFQSQCSCLPFIIILFLYATFTLQKLVQISAHICPILLEDKQVPVKFLTKTLLVLQVFLDQGSQIGFFLLKKCCSFSSDQIYSLNSKSFSNDKQSSRWNYLFMGFISSLSAAIQWCQVTIK